MGLEKSTYIVAGAWGKWDSKDVYQSYGKNLLFCLIPFYFSFNF